MSETQEREPTEATFRKDVAQHRMTVIHDHGVHRHLRFGKPGDSNLSFQITTWPGYLCYSGDMGCYVFFRVEDMFRFFRGERINPGYWAEKVQAEDREGVKEYDENRTWTRASMVGQYLAIHGGKNVGGDSDKGMWALHAKEMLAVAGFGRTWSKQRREVLTLSRPASGQLALGM